MDSSKLVKILKRSLLPIRKFMGRFVITTAAKSETDKLFYKAGSFVAADKFEGDYLEFGVFTGFMFSSAFHLIGEAYKNAYTPSVWNTEQDRIDRKQLWDKMRFIAFDSFQGLPKPTGIDIDLSSSNFVEGKFSNSEENFLNRITSTGVPIDRVVVVPGWFDQTLNEDTIKKHDIQHAAIIHIDSDLYESAKLVLDFVGHLLVDGTVIIFDDWYNFKGNPDLGEQKALKEWLDENPDWTATQYQKEGVWRNSFIMNKRISST